MARTTTVTHPDGTVSKRTSKSRAYTHAVVHVETRAHRVADARADLARAQEQVTKYAAMLADGVVANGERDLRPAGAFLGSRQFLTMAGQYASSYFFDDSIPGKTEAEQRPSDEAVIAGVQEWHDKAVAYVARAEAAVAKAEASPEVTYGVVRWSSRADLAVKAVAEFERLAVHGSRLDVVEVDA